MDKSEAILDTVVKRRKRVHICTQAPVWCAIHATITLLLIVEL